MFAIKCNEKVSWIWQRKCPHAHKNNVLSSRLPSSLKSCWAVSATATEEKQVHGNPGDSGRQRSNPFAT